MPSQPHPWKRGALGLLLVIATLAAVPASARIINAGAGGHIDFSSGFPPFDAPFGFVTTGVRRIFFGPAGGLFLQRWHLSPAGYAEGGTGIRMFRAPLAYFFNVPTNSYLFQRRNTACLATDRPAVLLIQFDAVFYLDSGGFPAHVAQLSYPVIGQNGPGPGSYSAFTAQLTFGQRPFTGGPITIFGTSTIAYRNDTPGAAFFSVRRNAFPVPQIPANWEFLVWGVIRFETRGCPPVFAAAADGLSVTSAAAGTGSDGQIGSQDDSPLPPDDTSIGDVPIPDPENIFMDMPLPEIPAGAGETVIERSEAYDGSFNHRPQLDPIPEQVTAEGQPLWFATHATDPDGDPLTFSLEGAPAGVAIDPVGIVTWTPAAGQSGVYRFKVQVTDSHGALSQADEEEVTVIVEGANHAPSLDAPDAFVGEGETLTHSLFAYDPDPADHLTFTLVSPAPAGALLSPDGLLTWTPTEEQGPRDYTFRVRVTDDGSPNLWRETAFTVQVGEANQPPIVEPIPPLNAVVGAPLSHQVVASDPDTRPGPEGGAAGPLSYELQGAPAGAAIDEIGLLTWTPGPDQLGTFKFGVVVTDQHGGSASQPVTVTVGGKAVQNQPGLNGSVFGNAGRGRRAPRVRP